MASPNLNLHNPKSSSWRNFLICLLVSTGQVAFGYPASVISTTLGQPSFLIYMNLIDSSGELVPGAEGIIGAMNGVFQVWVRLTIKDAVFTKAKPRLEPF